MSSRNKSPIITRRISRHDRPEILLAIIGGINSDYRVIPKTLESANGSVDMKGIDLLHSVRSVSHSYTKYIVRLTDRGGAAMSDTTRYYGRSRRLTLAASKLLLILALTATSSCYHAAPPCCTGSDSSCGTDGTAEGPRCDRASTTAWNWRNSVNFYWQQEASGNPIACEEFRRAVDNLSESAGSCRELCGFLECPSKSDLSQRCAVD